MFVRILSLLTELQTTQSSKEKNEHIRLVIVTTVIVLAAYIVATFNQFIQLRARLRNAFSQIDVQQKRRYDLIPNLVATAKAYMRHEQDTLERVIRARNTTIQQAAIARQTPGDAEGIQRLMASEAVLTNSLSRLAVTIERYPELRADRNMAALMGEMTFTENKIGFVRQAYNDAVMEYVSKRESFPSNLVAALFRFRDVALFQIENPATRQGIRVSF